MDVQVIERPALRVGALRHNGPYQEIGQTFRRLADIAGGAGLFQHPGAAMLAIYYDDPESTPPDRLRSDAAVAVAEGLALPTGLAEQRVPGGRYARTRHVGPYEQLGNAWASFKRVIDAGGHRRRDGASYELYLNDPMQTPKESLQTELYIPVA